MFDYSKIRTNGTSEGVGFYFTDNKEIAEHYADSTGYLYTVELNIGKSLSGEQKTISRNEMELLLKSIPEDIDFLSNYGDVDYEGYQSVLETTLESEYDYAESDADILGSLYNACGENQVIIELFYSVLGFDSIIANPDWGENQTIYIALTNEIVKIKEVSQKNE